MTIRTSYQIGMSAQRVANMHSVCFVSIAPDSLGLSNIYVPIAHDRSLNDGGPSFKLYDVVNDPVQSSLPKGTKTYSKNRIIYGCTIGLGWFTSNGALLMREISNILINHSKW